MLNPEASGWFMVFYVVFFAITSVVVVVAAFRRSVYALECVAFNVFVLGITLFTYTYGYQVLLGLLCVAEIVGALTLSFLIEEE